MEVASDQLAECPACRSVIPFEARVCPACGEPFPEEPAGVTGQDHEASTTSDSADRAVRGTSRRRERLLLYLGLFLMLAGGPGIAIFSWLHDALKIPVMNYDSFTVFGLMNRLVVAVGIIVAIVGIAVFILALRLSRPTAEEVEIRESRTS